MVGLQAMAQHRPIDLGQQSVVELHHVVGTDAKHVCVVGGMVDLAQRSLTPSALAQQLDAIADAADEFLKVQLDGTAGR